MSGNIYRVTVKPTKGTDFTFYTESIDTARGAGVNLDNGLGVDRLEIQRVDTLPDNARLI